MQTRALPLPEQIDAVRKYLRRVNGDLTRAQRDVGEGYRKRKICPFVETLRHRRARAAFETWEVAEQCLQELRHAHALSIAEFRPADQILSEVFLKGYDRSPMRLIIYDVQWSKPGSYSYHYLVWQVKKNGDLFQRGTTWLFPSKRVQLSRCMEPVTNETQRRCDSFRRWAQDFVANINGAGSVDEIVERITERRKRRGY
jgi:hypothetical protein